MAGDPTHGILSLGNVQHMGYLIRPSRCSLQQMLQNAPVKNAPVKNALAAGAPAKCILRCILQLLFLKFLHKWGRFVWYLDWKFFFWKLKATTQFFFSYFLTNEMIGWTFFFLYFFMFSKEFFLFLQCC